ncbi:hypothetical protein QC763_103855 [Podospora pseudopauciseta]|uniref:Uncharacterized protein n=1 Tax=Podospora pseudopauciseta TaxID=2093780 RepID=A0ABR0HX93_9PEZI|nr:hypothetical protein QC763_103855 [Podospora pseudopauciseta]
MQLALALHTLFSSPQATQSSPPPPRSTKRPPKKLPYDETLTQPAELVFFLFIARALTLPLMFEKSPG